MAAQPREPDSDTVLPQAVSDISSYIVRTYSYLLLESWNAAFLVRLEKYTERSDSIREVVGHLSENVNFTVGGFQKWLENSLARQSTNTQSQLIDLNSFSPSPSEYAPAPRLQARREIRLILRSASSDVLEDGSEPEFLNPLLRLLHQKGYAAYSALIGILFEGDVDPEIVAEVLRWLPGKAPSRNRDTVLAILRYGLRSSSNWIRYGAALGFASLGDKENAPYLEDAIARETIPDLKQDLEHILNRLKSK
jgi:hypothetical protein